MVIVSKKGSVQKYKFESVEDAAEFLGYSSQRLILAFRRKGNVIETVYWKIFCDEDICPDKDFAARWNFITDLLKRF